MERGWRELGYYAVAVVALLYPALLNGFPLLFPDSMEYLYAGNDIVAYFRGSGFRHFGLRSEVFNLSLFPLHLNRWLWPIVVVNSMLVAWTFRQMVEGRRRALVLVLGTALLSGLSWHVSRVMPDYMTGLVIIWLFLVLRGNERRLTTVVAAVLLGYGVLSHGSHLLLVLGLFALVAPFAAGRYRAGLGRVAITVVAAVVFQFGFSTVLYGRPHLFNPDAPPFLLARILADGTGVRYLQAHPEHPLAEHIDLISDDSDTNLWNPTGLRMTLKNSKPDLWREVRANQLRFVLKVAAFEPATFLLRTGRNAMLQLYLWELDDFERNGFTERIIKEKFPSFQVPYERSLQYRERLPLGPVRVLHSMALLCALVWIGYVVFRRRSELKSEEKLFLMLIVLGILVHSVVTGVISSPQGRYGSRVVWLIPFVALYLIRSFRLQSRADGK